MGLIRVNSLTPSRTWPGRLVIVFLAAVVAGALLLGGAPRAHAIYGGGEAGQQRGAAQLWLGPDTDPASDKQFICSAGVISSRWLLTAKHCITDRGNPAAGRLWIRAGHLTLAKGERRQVAAYHLTERNDLAALRLSSPLGSSVKVNELIPRGITPGSGAELAVSGWGRTSYENNDPSRKLKVCSMKVDRVENGPPSWVWANEDSGHPMKGDSGGPVLLGTKQIGVTSAYSELTGGARVVSLGTPDVRDWVHRTTGV